MSSATSINGTNAERLPHTGTKEGRDDPSAGSGSRRAESRDDTLRPWHFFVLVSLVAATAAVILAREARPEHLILISLTIGAAGFAGAALYRTLAPLVGTEARPAADGLSGSTRAVIEREKMLVLRSIKDLEFDRAMGKLSQKDFDEMSARLRGRAMSLMRQLDAGGGYRELIERELKARVGNPSARPAREKRVKPGPDVPKAASVAADPTTTCACGVTNDPDASFCKRCGTKLGAGSGA
jgi:hypothetical protein